MKITREGLKRVIEEVLKEVTPDGYENVVKGIKKSMKSGETPKTYKDKETGDTKETNPWAIANSMKNKGIKEDGSDNVPWQNPAGKYVVEKAYGGWAIIEPNGQMYRVLSDKNEAERLVAAFNGGKYKPDIEESGENDPGTFGAVLASKSEIERDKKKPLPPGVKVQKFHNPGGRELEPWEKKKRITEDELEESACAWDKIQADRKKRFQQAQGSKKTNQGASKTMKITKEQLTGIIKEVLDEMNSISPFAGVKGSDVVRHATKGAGSTRIQPSAGVKGSDVVAASKKSGTITRESLMSLVRETVEELMKEEPQVSGGVQNVGGEEDASEVQHNGLLNEEPIVSSPHDGEDTEDHSAAPHGDQTAGLVKENLLRWLLVSPKKGKRE